MTPGTPTQDERLDDLRAVAFQKANPRMPADPELTFSVDILPRRRPIEGRVS